MSDLRGRFYKTFANLPLGVRDEIVFSLDGQPVTWNVVKLEVDANSDLSKKILKSLEEMGLIRK